MRKKDGRSKSMKKGDKYVIEIAEVQKYHTENGEEFELGRVKGFKALTLDESALKKLKRVEEGNWNAIIGSMMTCPYCGVSVDVNITDAYFDHYTELPNYCPNCGAKMDGGEK